LTQLTDYYRDRAAVYDAVYAKPERQADLSTLREVLPPLVAGRRVLEIAAGTGYWTDLEYYWLATWSVPRDHGLRATMA
jgi:hypothetical protein